MASFDTLTASRSSGVAARERLHALQGKWTHSQGCEIEVQPNPDGVTVVITNPV